MKGIHPVYSFFFYLPTVKRLTNNLFEITLVQTVTLMKEYIISLSTPICVVFVFHAISEIQGYTYIAHSFNTEYKWVTNKSFLIIDDN